MQRAQNSVNFGALSQITTTSWASFSISRHHQSFMLTHHFKPLEDFYINQIMLTFSSHKPIFIPSDFMNQSIQLISFTQVASPFCAYIINTFINLTVLGDLQKTKDPHFQPATLCCCKQGCLFLQMGSQTSNFSTCITSSFHTLPLTQIEAKGYRSRIEDSCQC